VGDRYTETFDLAFGELSNLALNDRKRRAAAIARQVEAAEVGTSDLDSLEARLLPELGKRTARAIVAPLRSSLRRTRQGTTKQQGGGAIAVLTHKSTIRKAERLFDALMTLGYRPWLYTRSIRLGRRIRAADDEALLRSNYVVVLISRLALGSNFVDYELDLVHWLEMEERRERLLPIIVDELTYEDLPLVIRPLRAIQWGSGGVAVVAKEIQSRIVEDESRAAADPH
jgi:hypothetical protein